MEFDVGALLTAMGPAAPIVAFLIWRDILDRRDHKDRIEADKGLASALAALTEVVRGLRGNV